MLLQNLDLNSQLNFVLSGQQKSILVYHLTLSKNYKKKACNFAFPMGESVFHFCKQKLLGESSRGGLEVEQWSDNRTLSV